MVDLRARQSSTGDVGDPAGQVVAVGPGRVQRDPGRADHYQGPVAWHRSGRDAGAEGAARARLDQGCPVGAALPDPYPQFAGQAGEPGYERGGGLGVDLLGRPGLDQFGCQEVNVKVNQRSRYDHNYS